MRIPEFLNRDDYLQNPILRRFLKDHRISFVENRADYIREIEAYSERRYGRMLCTSCIKAAEKALKEATASEINSAKE